MEFTLEDMEVRVKDEPTDSDTNVETNIRSEHAEEFIRESLRTQTPSIDGEIDIKYEGSGIDYNSTTSAEGDHHIQTGTPSMFAHVSPKPGSQRPINSEQIELSEFYLRLLQCEQDCETCQKYIRKLSEHIRVTHAEGQPNRDPLIIDPDQSSAYEIKPEVVEDVEKMDCSEESMSNPDYNIESGNDSDPDYAPSPVLTRKVCLPNTNLSRHISTDPTGDKRSGSEGYGKGKTTQTGKKQSEMPFKCTGCDKGFTKKCLLTVHVRTHTGEKPFKCNLCLKGFSTKAYATVHMRGHTGDKPFNCDECNKSFLLKCNLDLHMRCHTGERPFKCIVCEKNFSRKLHLEDHVRSHTGDKLFKCDTCLKGFASKSNLTIHLRGHTGDKPFKCDLCLMAFTAKRYLNIHMRGHTANK